MNAHLLNFIVIVFLCVSWCAQLIAFLIKVFTIHFPTCSVYFLFFHCFNRCLVLYNFTDVVHWGRNAYRTQLEKPEFLKLFLIESGRRNTS